jgi:hypothetical protein
MAGDFGEVEPIHGVGGARPPGGEYDRGEGAPASPPAHAALRGLITGVRRRASHANGQPHLLDVTVGGDDHTEITVRLDEGVHGTLDGRRVVLYILDN